MNWFGHDDLLYVWHEPTLPKLGMHAIDHLLTNRFLPPDENHIDLGRRSSPESSRLIRGRFAGPVVFHRLPAACFIQLGRIGRSEEHTSELQSLMRISYAVFCLKKKKSQNHSKHL